MSRILSATGPKGMLAEVSITFAIYTKAMVELLDH